jgi:hypothetical protein
MPGFTESAITLNFPDTNFFRFADCQGYKPLSGHHFKEMDACWYDTASNSFWLFELKDFSLANLTDSANIEKRAWDITKKAVDTLCMFASSKHAYPYAVSDINVCLPAIPNAATVFRFITIVHCDPNQRADVQLLNDSFKNKFKPYAKLFAIDFYGVMEHSRAILNIPNGMIQ